MARLRRPTLIALVGALLALTAMPLAACGGSDSPGEAGAEEPSATVGEAGEDGNIEGAKIFILGCTNENPWCNGFNKTLEEGLSEAGGEVTVLTSNFDPAEQTRQMSQAISQRAAAVLIHVADPGALVPSLRRAQTAGVPVIAVDTDVGEETRELFAASLLPDHAKLGEFAAINIQEGLKEQGIESGNVIMITGTGSQIHVQTRIQAFRDQLATTPEYEVVEIQDANWDPIETARIAQQLFAKYGRTGIQGAYGMADYMAAAISRAAQQADIPLYPQSDRGLVVTGSNCAGVGMESIRDGLMYGGATQSPILEARDFVPYVIRFLNGEDIGEQVTTPVDRITRENADEFEEPCDY
jgi:ABC-type sugar transport system substrate-binding protein